MLASMRVAGRSAAGDGARRRASLAAAVRPSGRSTQQRPMVPLVEPWNGLHWTTQRVSSPAPYTKLVGIACWSRRGCLAVGGQASFVIGPGRPLAERLAGSRWQAETPVRPAGYQDSLLYDVSCPSRSLCFAVGAAIRSYAGGSNASWQTLAEVSTGRDWRIKPTPNPKP